MIEGARVRRAESWILNSRTCAMVGNLMLQVAAFGGGKGDKKALSTEDFLPAIFSGRDEQEEYESDYERWKSAIDQDRAKTDRTNEKRRKHGLPPLPYKDITLARTR